MTEQGQEQQQTTPTVAYRVRRLRRQAGLTQYQLAEQLGINQAQISRLERYGHGISLEMIQAIARLLGASLSYLYGEDVPLTSKAAQAAERVRTDPDTPPGLRELAYNTTLCDELNIQQAEWERLLALELPQATPQEECLELLLLLRRVFRHEQ